MSENTTVSAAADAQDISGIRVQADVEALAPLSDDERRDILAYHQHIISDRSYTWKRVKDDIGYDSSTMSRVFRGKYAGSYGNIVTAIRRYFENRKVAVAKATFVKNAIAKTIWNAFDYALANSTGALIIGPSRTGKTEAAKAYAESDSARGRVVYFQVPPIGGGGALLAGLCRCIGASRKLIPAESLASICRALGPSRLLVVDEAHRMLGASSKSIARQLEVVRYLHDETKCAFALIATARFEDELSASSYLHEQLIGRICAPIRVGEKLRQDDWLPIVHQFIVDDLDSETIAALEQVVNAAGRVAALVHTLQLATRDAALRKEQPGPDHIARAIQWRRQKFNQAFFREPHKGGKP